MQISYAIPIYLRITNAKHKFKQNVFNLGRYSLFLGWISFIWLCFSTSIMLFPTEFDPVGGITCKNFNFTPVIVTLAVMFVLAYWNYSARHFFKGPVVAQEEIPIVNEEKPLLKEAKSDEK